MPLVNSNRRGARDLNPRKAMQIQVALDYLKAIDEHHRAINQSTDFRRLDSAQTNLQNAKQSLLHYHDGDATAASQTVDEAEELRMKGKRDAVRNGQDPTNIQI
jgi:hypothetical protein